MQKRVNQLQAGRPATPDLPVCHLSSAGRSVSLLETFQGNAVLFAVARLLTYGMVCMAVITLRKK
jgi:hypothetical protein